MTRTIRILGAALGAFVLGLGIARGSGAGLFTGSAYTGLLLAAWTISWMIVGFAVLPYLTIVPAQWLNNALGAGRCPPPSSLPQGWGSSSASCWVLLLSLAALGPDPGDRLGPGCRWAISLFLGLGVMAWPYGGQAS